MKKIITVLFIAITSIAFSQEAAELKIEQLNVSKDFEQKIDEYFVEYFKDTKAQDWNKVMDRMPTKFLEFMSKESLISQTEKAFNNEAFTTTFNNIKFQNVINAFNFDNIAYIKVNYLSSFTFNFIQSETQTDKEFNTYLDFMAGIFTNQFKGQKVEREGNGITISGIKTIILIDDSSENGLKMIEYDNKMIEFYKMIFPEEAVINFQMG